MPEPRTDGRCPSCGGDTFDGTAGDWLDSTNQSKGWKDKCTNPDCGAWCVTTNQQDGSTLTNPVEE